MNEGAGFAVREAAPEDIGAIARIYDNHVLTGLASFEEEPPGEDEMRRRFADVKEMKPSTLKRFFRLPRFDEHLELHRLDCLASHRDLSLYNYAREKLAELPAEQIRPQPLLTGDDLIAMGYTPGPQFKQILAAVEDAQLESRIGDPEQARAFVRREFPSVAK